MIKGIRKFLDNKVEPHFTKGGKLSYLYPLYEMVDTILYTPSNVTKNASHVRDGIDQKRIMITVVIALVPCILLAMYNIGYQANLALAEMGQTTIAGWQGNVLSFCNIPLGKMDSAWQYLFYGALYFVPMYAVVMLTGGLWEVAFAIIRKHEIAEAFLVTGTLIALILPPSTPLWQVFLGTSFGVVIGKEIFGGVGFNFLNPALTARVFLFFAYPAELSGDAVWVAVDGYTKATPLALGAQGGLSSIIEAGYTWKEAFLGLIPGSAGETSTLMVLIGAFILLVMGIGSWRIMVSVVAGALSMVLLFNVLYHYAIIENPFFSIPFWWQFVIGGFAFGCVFMATDPVSAAMTAKGKLIYGFFIGVFAMIIRIINPAYPEGIMLAILFMNLFAPIIDYFFIQNNIKRRKQGYVKSKRYQV